MTTGVPEVILYIPTRKAIIYAALFGFVAYCWGLLTLYLEVFPYDYLRSAKQRLVANKVTPRHPGNLRARQFELFAPKADIVMIGDSLTEGGLWNDMFPEVRLLNRGIAGDTTEKVIERLNAIIATEPRRAFIMLGINDLQEKLSVDHIFDNYLRIVRRLHTENIEIVIQSTLECAEKLCGSDTLESVRKLNRRLKMYARANHFTYIDLNSEISSFRGLPDEHTVNGVHLTAQAYWVWYEILKPYMRPGPLRPQ